MTVTQRILGERGYTVQRFDVGTYGSDAQYTRGSRSTFFIRGALQPLDDPELLQLPEQWRTRARWKLYTQTRLRTVDQYKTRDADRIVWRDEGLDRDIIFLVAKIANYSDPPATFSLCHFRYALIEQEWEPTT